MTYVQNKARYPETTASWQSFGGSDNSTVNDVIINAANWSDKISKEALRRRAPLSLEVNLVISENSICRY